MASINMKRGDSFGFSNEIFEDDGTTKIIGIASNLKCQIRDRYDVLVDELEITESIELPGTYLFRAGPTSEWAVGPLYSDIQYTVNGLVASTLENIVINVERDVTR